MSIHWVKRLPLWLKILAGICLVFIYLVVTIAIPNGPTFIHAKEAQARATMWGFIAGLKNYKEEYHEFPVGAFTDAANPQAMQCTRGAIMEALHPDQSASPGKNNLRRIDFYDAALASKKKTNGLYYDEHHEPVLVDPWGEPYYFFITPKGEEKVPNPDPRSNKTQPFIEKPVIMFSAGPDHDRGTWDDNVLSWK